MFQLIVFDLLGNYHFTLSQSDTDGFSQVLVAKEETLRVHR